MPNDIANNMVDTIHQLEKELKDLREENKVLTSECDRLIKEKGELLKKSEQIAEYKRLLKAAVEDFSNMYDHIYYCDGICDACPLHGERDHCLIWRHAAEALALIGEEANHENPT